MDSSPYSIGSQYHCKVKILASDTAEQTVVRFTPNTQPEAEKWSTRANTCGLITFILAIICEIKMHAA
ncbi:hypothetical protein N7475_008957 [Penicillium sp. IBT 31633x]|nr:hypothetical protein N7475_008957 [Penicillium sp. IBT 31633x]